MRRQQWPAKGNDSDIFIEKARRHSQPEHTATLRLYPHVSLIAVYNMRLRVN